MRPVRLTRAQQQALTRERLLAAAERFELAAARAFALQFRSPAIGRVRVR